MRVLRCRASLPLGKSHSCCRLGWCEGRRVVWVFYQLPGATIGPQGENVPNTCTEQASLELGVLPINTIANHQPERYALRLGLLDQFPGQFGLGEEGRVSFAEG